MSRKKIIIAVVGMAGAGKTSCCQYLIKQGFASLRFGDETDLGLEALGLSLTEGNERKYRENLRKELGMAAYAIKIKPRIEKTLKTHDKIVLDGLYSWEEYVYLKKSFPHLITLCIYTQRDIRYQRINSRKIRALTLREAEERDVAELINLHKGSAIALADYLIINNGSVEELDKNLKQFLGKL